VNLIGGDSLSIIDPPTIGPAGEASSRADEEILSSIAPMMYVRLRSADLMALAASNTANDKVYDLYLRGRGELKEYLHVHRLGNAIDFFKQATMIDSRCTLADAGLGEAYR